MDEFDCGDLIGLVIVLVMLYFMLCYDYCYGCFSLVGFIGGSCVLLVCFGLFCSVYVICD